MFSHSLKKSTSASSTAEPVTDEHVAPEELAEPEVAHAQATARGTVVGAMARALVRGAPRRPR